MEKGPSRLREFLSPALALQGTRRPGADSSDTKQDTTSLGLRFLTYKWVLCSLTHLIFGLLQKSNEIK